MKENRTEIICIRITRQERDLMDEVCEDKNTTPSRLLRRLLSEKFASKYDIKIEPY